jgi:hypothetical protein
MEGRDKEADQTLRQRILKSIAILEDTDPNNDILGYFGLAQTLFIAGRRDDAMTVMAPILASLDRAKARYKQRRARSAGLASPPLSNDIIKGPTAESSSAFLDQTKSQEQDETEAEAETDQVTAVLMDMWETSSASCNGCKRPGIEYDEIYYCESCMNTSLCEICYPKMMTGDLEISNCSPTHKFTRVYPIPEEVKGVATHVVNGKLLPRKEWLDKLRSDWAA